MMAESDIERTLCSPIRVVDEGFNKSAVLPYGVSVVCIQRAMQDFTDFLGFINLALYEKKIQRIETFLMPANFSSIVGEFMTATIPRYCTSVVKNNYHNGHPDLVPTGLYPKDAMLHGDQGIEVKASRHLRGWQGHNAEDVWLLVFSFESNTPRDVLAGRPGMPFRFLKVVGAQLTKDDWQFSGRSETSRRTITASVKRSGFEKMEANWIYRNL